MKITVDRVKSLDGELIFMIKVKDPHSVPFSEEEMNALVSMDRCTKEVTHTLDPTHHTYQLIANSFHNVKEKIFTKLLSNLKFSISNELETMFTPICQEIYNWIYDHQHGHVKTWMSEFDPLRTKYYFNNDKKCPVYDSNRLYISDDKIDDDEDDE